MLQFIDSFADCFKTNSPNNTQLASRYVSGLLSQTQRKNMERMDERLGDDEALGEDIYQATQQFISSSRWDYDAVYRQLCARADRRLGGSVDSVLVIDESGNTKKGRSSVGVGQQYNGRLGKQDNCQVGVYAALNCGTRVTIIGARLFLPEDWINDPERCRKAGVPEERIEQGHRTKIDHARELLEEALANGVQFACVSMDALYGRNAGLRRSIEEKGIPYCMDIPANARLFASKPEMSERPKQITKATQSAGELAKEAVGKNKKQAIQIVQLREGDHGIVEAKVKAIRVWEWKDESEQAEELWLIIRVMPDGSTKLSLSNATENISLKRLARWQAGRFWVERCFQDAKSHCGMGQYQARGWLAWHHHMALVALAVYFQMEERLVDPAGLGNLTASDITEMIEWVVIRKPSEAELLERIERRHRAREKSKMDALQRQRAKQQPKPARKPRGNI
jgi:SRSO17 transposase